jgi:hypothetical protein
MKNQFYGYYRPDEDQLQDLWQHCLFILDTSVLLSLYRYPEEARNEWFEILNSISDRLWIPHQAALEFQENRLSVIAEQVQIYDEVTTIIQESLDKLKRELEQKQLSKRHSKIDPRNLLDEVDRLFQSFIDGIEELKKEQPDVFDDDTLRKRIDQILEGKVGKPFGSQDELDEIYREGKSRYENESPPGFLDKGKVGGVYTYEGLVYKRDYGDLILWKQIIQKVSEDENYKHVIFVTQDVKRDWWWKVDSKGEKTIGPRPELVQEIISRGKIESFYMYNSDRFLHYAKEYLKLAVSDKTIDQVRDIIEVTSDIRTERFSPYLKRIIQHLWNDGDPREASISEFLEHIGAGAYGNHSKLCLAPWRLVEKGEASSVRRLTERGISFAKGELQIPHIILKDPESQEWAPHPETEMLFVTDIGD